MTTRILAVAVLAPVLMIGACGGDEAVEGGPDPDILLPLAPTRSWSFDDLPASEPPAGWKIEQTNPQGEGALWSVLRDPAGSQTLVLTNPRGATGTAFNLAWTDEVAFQDGRVEVKVKGGRGSEDQGGGPIWRVQDKDNYYVARWSPLTNNVRLYYVRDGEIQQLETANIRVPAGVWHTLTIEHRGERITGYFDGERVWESEDDTFTEPGGVGVWTRADAASLFDDLAVTVEPAP